MKIVKSVFALVMVAAMSGLAACSDDKEQPSGDYYVKYEVMAQPGQMITLGFAAPEGVSMCRM